ncbi:MAG: glycosyltransferase family 39 protein [Chloroflexi bacterium]|nr:glycosyltransferase family 39 protein [Chloroflexota bacterium]
MALAGFVLVWVATQKYGIGLGSDAVGYVHIAREILAGRGVSPGYTLQPPLYPLTLALFGAITFSDPLDAAVLAHALMLASVIFIAGVLFLRHLAHSPFLALAGTLGVLFSLALLNVTLTAFSELEFILLTLVALLSIERYGESTRARWPGVAIVATAGACLTRYIGVALVGAGALALVWLLRAQPKRARLTASVFAFLSALPLGLWALRNWSVTGEPFGPRAASRVGLFENIRLAVETFAGWFAPDALTWLVWGVLFVASALGIAQYITHKKTRDGKTTLSLAPYALFVALYVLLLALSATTTGINRIGTRLLSPIYVPAWLIVLVIFDRILDLLRPRWSARIVNAAALGIVALALVYPSSRSAVVVARAVEQGAGGFNTTRWRTSETLQYVKQHRAEMTRLLYTNGPDVLYILGNVDAQSIPPKFQYASNERAIDANALRGTFPGEPVLLIWFDRIGRDDFLFSLEELDVMTRLTLIAQLRDGAVYRMEKR